MGKNLKELLGGGRKAVVLKKNYEVGPFALSKNQKGRT